MTVMIAKIARMCGLDCCIFDNVAGITCMLANLLDDLIISMTVADPTCQSLYSDDLLDLIAGMQMSSTAI